MLHFVHSLMLSDTFFHWPLCLRTPWTVPCKIAFDSESCWFTWPNQTSLRCFTIVSKCYWFPAYFMPHSFALDPSYIILITLMIFGGKSMSSKYVPYKCFYLCCQNPFQSLWIRHFRLLDCSSICLQCKYLVIAGLVFLKPACSSWFYLLLPPLYCLV
jgi:hypothetical protein